MSKVGARRDKLQNFFLHSHIEKKIPKEALVCLEKIIAVIAFWLFVMNDGDHCFHVVLKSKCFTQNLFYGYDYYDHPLHKCFPAYQFPNPLVG
jgi:hypothetical protein